MLAEHLASTFPTSVEKGTDYGDVDPVLIDAAIYGWALKVAKGSSLDPAEHRRFRAAREDLERALPCFPKESLPYFEKLVALATAVLAVDGPREH